MKQLLTVTILLISFMLGFTLPVFSTEFKRPTPEENIILHAHCAQLALVLGSPKMSASHVKTAEMLVKVHNIKKEIIVFHMGFIDGMLIYRMSLLNGSVSLKTIATEVYRKVCPMQI